MAFKTLALRLFTNSLAFQHKALSYPSKSSISPDPGDNGVFRRFFHKKGMFHVQPSILPDIRSLLIGDRDRDQNRFNGLIAPNSNGLTVEDARKVLKVVQMEMVKSKLREIEKSWIPYSDFVRICGQNCSDPEQGIRIAKILDQSGCVILIGDIVFLHPEQVAKTLEEQFRIPSSNPRNNLKQEFESMETQKASIDKNAESQVRQELWCGLGFLVIQTAGFMRLTFWELSWDVMEPICFYVTSINFMIGYGFFIRTSKEPSFEGFFKSRFNVKQQRLMKINDFDINRYNEIRKVYLHH